MSSILDAFPYPWHERDAQHLHVMLSQIHPTAQSALLVAERSGIDTTLINPGQAPSYLWKDILTEAAVSGVTRDLVQQVHDLLNVKSSNRPFLADCLANVPVRADSEPRGEDGTPDFLKGNDDVSEPEALLYYDDLTIQFGRLPGLIKTLEQLIVLGSAVCRLTVDIHGAGQYGTAFRIGPDRLLTNWHVLHSEKGMRATAVTAEFGYDDDGSGGALAATAIPCDVNSIVTDRTDDWGVIVTQQPLADTWTTVKLSEAVAPTLHSPAYIIQHPGGDRKRVGFVRNQVSSFDDQVVHYLTDTEAGASGSPVFDNQGRLIALHHAGGRPQEVVGRSPLKKNEGIRIARILEGLKQNGINSF